MQFIKEAIRLLRPKQWIKNGFVLVPLFFTPQAVNRAHLIEVGIAFVAFCSAASMVYVFNDWQDRVSDRKHPTKRQRPIAAGKISGKMALAILILLGAITCGLTARIGAVEFSCYIGAYLALNLVYCLWLRNIALLDIAAISASFLLRLGAGIALIEVSPSPWIVIMTGLLALFLATAKRRDDVVREYDLTHRQSLHGYNLIFLDSLLQILCSVLLAAYFIYTTDAVSAIQYPHHESLMTTPFVVLGLMRYLQITKVEKGSGSPTDLLWQDRWLQACVAGWFLTFGGLLYGYHH